MAAVINFFQRPNNINAGTWNWGDVAFGFRSGLLLNEPPLRAIQYNNASAPPNLHILQLVSYVTMPLIATSKAGSVARTEGLISNHLETLKFGAWALMASNALAAPQELYRLKVSEGRTFVQKVQIAAWRMTPYLVLLTNIALTILELRVNRMKALVSLTVTVVTLLDLTSITNQSFNRYLNTVLRLPMDLVALYYGSNKNRFWIMLGWAQVPLIRDPIAAWINPFVPKKP